MKYFKANLLLYITIVFLAGYACSDMSGINNGKEKTSKNNDLFSFSPRSEKQAEKHEQSLKSKPIVSDVEIAEISNNAASFFKEKQVFNFNVSATKKFQINTTKITENRNGSTSLIGELVGGYGFSFLVRTPKGISGTLRTKDELYKVEPAAGGLALISLIDEMKFPQEHSSKIPLGSMADSLSKTNISNLKAQSSSPFTTQSYHAPNGGPTHGVLVLYTQSVANNTYDITGLIQTANDETNQIYANSNVLQNVYIAHSEQTSYNESGRSFERRCSCCRSLFLCNRILFLCS